MKKFIIIILIFLNLGFVFAIQEVDLDNPESLIKKETTLWQNFKNIINSAFSWLWNKITYFFSEIIWPIISAPLSKEIDTRKEQVEDKVEETTKNVQESLLERFKSIIRYEE